jgi:membrane protein YdbS with pleckstrin-like domain
MTAGQNPGMGIQRRTRSPLSDRTLRQLRQTRRLNTAITLVLLVNFAMQLASGDREWWVWTGGAAIILFLGSLVMTTRQLKHHRAPPS